MPIGKYKINHFICSTQMKNPFLCFQSLSCYFSKDGLGQISTNAQGSNSFFGKAKLGYDVFFANDDYAGTADLSGGLFLGFGGGVILTNNVFVELSYQILHGSVNVDYYYRDSYTMDVTQTNLSILVGLRMK